MAAALMEYYISKVMFLMLLVLLDTRLPFLLSSAGQDGRFQDIRAGAETVWR